jgi:hypothetical protein
MQNSAWLAIEARFSTPMPNGGRIMSYVRLISAIVIVCLTTSPAWAQTGDINKCSIAFTATSTTTQGEIKISGKVTLNGDFKVVSNDWTAYIWETGKFEHVFLWAKDVKADGTFGPVSPVVSFNTTYNVRASAVVSNDGGKTKYTLTTKVEVVKTK